jgi:hypothetical protein
MGCHAWTKRRGVRKQCLPRRWDYHRRYLTVRFTNVGYRPIAVRNNRHGKSNNPLIMQWDTVYKYLYKTISYKYNSSVIS